MSEEREPHSAPGNGGSIPQELTDFFAIGGRSLLVRGEAGTGKTTLALTLLSLLDATKNFLYLSTRESPSLFYRDHPWLFDDKRGRKKGEEDESSGGPVGFVDARLDEPAQLFERITSQLMDASSPVILIDALDALQDFVDAKALRNDVRVLQTWCERAGAKLIVTMADPDAGVLDSLMDGVVVLRQRLLENRRLRQIELHKLYGVRMARPSCYFTLNGGRFKTFSEWIDDDVSVVQGTAVAIPQSPHERGRSGFYSTGYAELDGALGGGLPARGTTTINMEHAVSIKVAFLLIAKSLASFPGDGKVLLTQFEGLAPEFVDGYVGRLPKRSRERVFLLKEADDLAGHEGSLGPILSVVDGSTARPELFRRCVALSRSSNGTMVIISRDPKGKPSGPGGPGARVRVSYLAGSVLLASEVPFSQYFGVGVSNMNGLPILELEPMV